jgi:alpha-ribazole phosphatase
MEIYLVRHTKVALNKQYCYGISDVDLAESYDDDIILVKDKLKGIDFSKSYSSPLKRCKLLSNALVNDAIEESALLEMSLGDWELQKWADLDQDIVNEWMHDFVNISPPNSESYIEYAMKPVFFFDELIRPLNENDKVLLTSHSGAIRAIICHVLNMPLAHAFNFEVDYGSVSKIEVIDGWCKLKHLNY